MEGERAGPRLRGQRALVMGLGTRHGGVGVARYLAGAGAEVTVTDLRPAAELGGALEALAGLPIRYVLGEHRPEDFTGSDLVVRNPGVPADSPWLALARSSGARIEMEMTLFFRACSAPIVGITGTKGKTTTSTLCAGILQVDHPDTVLAGNMGASALDALPRITPTTPVVLEISSFQLEGMGEHGQSPHVAVITNISQDHLNRYPSFDAYVEVKRNIARFQQPGDWLIVNRDDPLSWASRAAGPAATLPFGRGLDADTGASLDGDRLVWRDGGREIDLCDAGELKLTGAHAALDALAATAAAIAAGAAAEDARRGLLAAEPVRDRQERVATVGGVLYVNDTTATAPAAVMAALDAFRERPVVLIAGGAGKGADLAAVLGRVAAEVKGVVLLDGSATPEFRRLLDVAGAHPVLGPFSVMDEAVRAATALAVAGDVVLLSPGVASFGIFRDEFERGEAFRRAVERLGAAGRDGVRR
ncbi:MAG TPA: UDP-N-acetylmuramoyl-L-alanine--D-glutamate ligase [Thermomicrobiaceae bacterium]|nr:UDP-N-acetylmuramoyl-L-alanine--D-glutamate ligase [Thermomicrobiaceae bacterium]